MILKFPKLFKGKNSDADYSREELVEANVLEETNEGENEPSEGRVSVHFTNASLDRGELLVGFFIENGFKQRVKFHKLPLVLLDSERRILAQQVFEGTTVGVIKGGTSKACVVRFLRPNVYTEELPDNLKICFDVRSLHPEEKVQGIDFQTLPQGVPVNLEQGLKEILAGLPPIKQGEVNFAPLCAKLTEKQELLATVIIRNGTDNPVVLEKLPLTFFDARQKEVARGVFDVNNITIESHKAVLWTFTFKSVVLEKDADLSSWYVSKHA